MTKYQQKVVPFNKYFLRFSLKYANLLRIKSRLNNKKQKKKNSCRFYRDGRNIRKNLEKLVNSVIKAIIAIPFNGR